MSAPAPDLARDFVRIGTRAEFPADRAVICVVDGHEIAVWQIDGVHYAMSTICPHQHVPLLAEGSRDGLVVTCPAHGWSYRIDSGCGVHSAGRVQTYRVHVDETHVYVERPPEPAEPMW